MPRKRSAGTIAILGTGLIGTSIGLALRAGRTSQRIVGWDRSFTNLRLAKRRRAIDQIATDLHAAVRDAAIVVVALPFEVVKSKLSGVLRSAALGALVMDTAPLKSKVMAIAAKARQHPEKVWFIGGHPLAGSEKSGPTAAHAALFEGRTFFICVPASQKMPSSVRQTAERFIRTLGAVPVAISARRHDRIVALTSALPQIVASTVALSMSGQGVAKHLVGPGLVDTTRLASIPSHLWTNNLAANKTNVERALELFERSMRAMRLALASSDRSQIDVLLRRAAAARRRFA